MKNGSYVSVSVTRAAIAAAAFASVLAPSAAHADRASAVGTFTLTGLTAFSGATVNTGQTEVVLNIEACRAIADGNRNVTMQWELAREPAADLEYAIKLVAPGDACAGTVASEASDTCEVFQRPSPLTQTVSAAIPLDQILSRVDRADACLDAETAGTFEVRFIFEHTLTTGTTEAQVDGTSFRLETRRPTAPGAPTLRAGESTIQVSWDAVSSAEGYRLYYSQTAALLDTIAIPEDVPSGVSTASVTSGGTTREITGLETDKVYFVSVASVDSAGNPSLLGPAASATTIPTADFFELYRESGGVEEGGCASGRTRPAPTGAALAFLAALSIAARRRW